MELERRLDRWLADRARRRGPVRRIETHLSRLVFGPRRGFKRRRWVRYPFVDFTALGARLEACREEVRLNAELAPGVYRAVVLLRCENGALRPVLDRGGAPPPHTVDAFTVLRRLPEEGMLDRTLVERPDSVTPHALAPLARRLARFHARQPRDEEARRAACPAALARLFETNAREALDAARGTSRRIERRVAWAARRLSGRIAERRDLLAERAVRACELHGDLHAGNVCRVGGDFVVYDRLEFRRDFRLGDPAADVGFLAMDLARHGRADLALAFADAYAEAAGDPDLLRAVPLYAGHYGLVRAKVALLAGRREAARRATEAALLFLSSPWLLVLCGPPASGKSTVADRLRRSFGAEVLSSDAARKALFGREPNERLDAAPFQGPYDPAVTERVYGDLSARCRRLLSKGRSVVVDAQFPDRRRRTAFVRRARELGVEWAVVWLDTPREVCLQRLRERLRRADRVSDADEAVFRVAWDRFEPPLEVPLARLVRLRPDQDPSSVRRRVLDRALLHEPASRTP